MRQLFESVSFSFGNKKYPVHKGSLVFAFNSENFSATSNDKLEYMYIQFSGARCDTLFNRFGINHSNRVFENFEGSVPLWLDAVLRTEESNIDLAGEAILLHTFSRLSNELLKKDSLVNQIITLTEKYFSDSSLSISKIADHLSYNPKYLSHIFKRE